MVYKEMNTEESNQTLIKYIDDLEKENFLLKSELTNQKRAQESFEKHSEQVIVEIRKQTSIFGQLVDAVKDLRPVGRFG